MGPSLDRDRIRRALPGMVQDIKTVLLGVERAAVANGLPARSAMRYKARGQAVIKAREDWEEACEAAAAKGGPEPAAPKESKDEQLLAEYASEINAAMQAGVKARLARIAQGKHGWQGSAWILERSFGLREDYSPPVRVEHTGKGGKAIQVQQRVDNANEGRAVLGFAPLEVADKPDKPESK